MASFNKIIVVGYLGRDPEIRYTPQGTAVCSFTIASTEKITVQGEKQDVTTWFQVKVWGRQGEVANQYLHKGKQIYIEGRLRQEEWTDKEGNRRTSLVITTTDVQFLGTKDEDQRSYGGGQHESAKERDGDLVGAGKGGGDDDIPF